MRLICKVGCNVDVFRGAHRCRNTDLDRWFFIWVMDEYLYSINTLNPICILKELQQIATIFNRKGLFDGFINACHFEFFQSFASAIKLFCPRFSRMCSFIWIAVLFISCHLIGFTIPATQISRNISNFNPIFWEQFVKSSTSHWSKNCMIFTAIKISIFIYGTWLSIILFVVNDFCRSLFIILSFGKPNLPH